MITSKRIEAMEFTIKYYDAKGYKEVLNNIQYYNDARILEKLEFSDKVMRKLNCKTIDISTIAIEETALIIMNTLGYKYNL